MTINENDFQEDLEKKIDEAEMEAQLEDIGSEKTVESSFDGEVTDAGEEEPPEKKKPTKARLIFRRILIWLVVLVIAFAAGFFVDAALRYQPALTRIQTLVTELETSQQEIADLESEVDRLRKLEEKNLALEEEISLATVHLTLLGARAAVADASLALEQDRVADAKLSLEKLGSTLESLEMMVTADQADVVESMIQRQELILNELDDDVFSAQSDLEVLAAKLNALENTLFASP